MTAPLTTLVNFPYLAGFPPLSLGDLIADSDGDLFGVAPVAPNNEGEDNGLVFEIAKTAGGYASTPTTIASFDGKDGTHPLGGLIADANGDLFGTTVGDVLTNDRGTVFEIAKTPTGYDSVPAILVTFNGANGQRPNGSLIADAKGDLLGTTQLGGPSDNDFGTVFEITKTPTGYANAPTTLVSFNKINGEEPMGGLIADANGDLFGAVEGGPKVTKMTVLGPLTGFADGGVFELAKTASGYASDVTTLASFFPLQNGGSPTGSLIANSNGDLFGMNSAGGPLTGGLSFGDVFEIARTATGYAADTELATFYGPNGSSPMGGLISDAIGDLFGTTSEGGADPLYGTVFEIKRTLTGYANAPTTLVSFDGANGGSPQGSLIADANGDLFGTTPAGNGTVFEITDSGFVTGPPPAVSSDILWQNANGQASIWDMSGNSLAGGGPVSPNPGPSWRAVGTGDFNKDGHSDILWQNTDGQASIWDMNGNSLIGGGPVTPNPGPAWKAVGTGDFTDDGFSNDILWQNTSTGQASIWEMSGNSLIGGGAVTPNPGPSWKAIGTGDFNKDGFSDILFQNTSSGQVSIWEMHGNNLIGGGPVSPNPGPAWHAIGTGDFNHDGFSDILLQNTTSGQVSIWEMNGNALIGGGPVSSDPSPSWRAIGTGGGGSEILLQNTSSGQVSISDMNGTSIIGGGPVGPNPGTSWHAIGAT